MKLEHFWLLDKHCFVQHNKTKQEIAVKDFSVLDGVAFLADGQRIFVKDIESYRAYRKVACDKCKKILMVEVDCINPQVPPKCQACSSSGSILAGTFNWGL